MQSFPALSPTSECSTSPEFLSLHKRTPEIHHIVPTAGEVNSRLVQEAKARVYKITHTSGGSSASKKGAAGKAQPVLEPVLEEQPKWLLLREVVEEIQAQRGAIASMYHSTTRTAPSGDQVCHRCT